MTSRSASEFVRASVDLTDGRIVYERLTPTFLGGRGENHAHLLRLLKVNPDAARDVLLFATGPLVGIGYPGASRVNLAGPSPLTGGLGSASAGGPFAAAMRSAGFEQLVVHGVASMPSYLVLRDGVAERKDARAIWGETVDAADAWLRAQEGPEVSTAIIGPAGEHGVMAAAVIFDGRKAAGRCALGALMGRKRLKAVVVPKGDGLRVRDADRLHDVAADVVARIGRSSQDRVRQYGTIELSPVAYEPVCNFQRGVLSEDERRAVVCDRFTPFFVEAYGCPGCPVDCGREYRVESGPFAGARSSGLHANTVTDFGARLGIFDPAAIIAAHGACNRLGLDIDNTSGVIAWAMEAVQRGALRVNDHSAPELSWGNGDGVLTLIEMIARRKGIGNLLADGCVRAARRLGRGSERYAISVKGQELEEILRPYKGWALGVMVSERGGTHTRGAPVIELSGMIPGEIAHMAGVGRSPLDAESYEGKPEIVVFYERLHAVLDSVGMCYSISAWTDPILPSFDDLASALIAAVGGRWTSRCLNRLGEQIHTLGKLYNLHVAGFTRGDDIPPPRLQTESLEGGAILDRSQWDRMLDRYYALHQWGIEDGAPDRACLEDVGLKEFAWLARGPRRGNDSTGGME